jgi:hypothetical protein
LLVCACTADRPTRWISMSAAVLSLIAIIIAAVCRTLTRVPDPNVLQ